MSVLRTRKIRNSYRRCIFFGIDQIKSVHISINTNEVIDAINEAKDEEPLITYNSVINATRYFKLFECSKNSFKILITPMNERA